MKNKCNGVPFRSVNSYDFNINNIDDNYKYIKIIKNNLNFGKKLYEILKNDIDFYFSPLGEIFVRLDNDIEKDKLDYLKKYFIIYDNNKIGSRGLGYYGLFGDAYKIENEDNYYKQENIKKTWETLWKEYDEYIKGLELLKNDNELKLIYLDNYRNFVLLWIYILITLLMSENQYRPLKEVSFIKVKNKQKIEKLINELVKQYDNVIYNFLNLLYNKDSNIKNLESIDSLYNSIKKIFFEKFFITKRGLVSLNEYFNNTTLTKVWFEKIFRNNREEDNLGVIFSVFLNNYFNIYTENDNFSLKDILNKINGIKNKFKNKNIAIFSVMYGGIEFALIAKYLGYNAGLINYSVYHLNNKNIYIAFKDIFYPLDNNIDFKNTKNFILDDNTVTGTTLEKIRTILESNNLSVSNLVVPRIFLNKEEREILKSIDKLENLNEKIISKLKSKYNIEELKINDLKKNLVLNFNYLLPRDKYKGRNINYLVGKKVHELKKHYNKRFRSL